jgi:MFS family permease
LITRRVVGIIGTSQLVMWGVSYYLIGIFGPAIEKDTQWSQPFVYGGFSAALLAMGIVSPWAGRAIDRHGGAKVMATGSGLVALACCGIALTRSPWLYYAGWILMGVAMRLTLYDAAFATLARRAGVESKRAMSQVTLFGGLASTAFWPVGGYLQAAIGWRGGVLVYAAVALSMAALLLSLPTEERVVEDSSAAADAASPPVEARGGWIEASLYATIIALVAFLNSAMSSHMIVMLTGLGMGLATAVTVSTLRGIGQTGGRLGEIVFGKRLDPLQLNVIATALIPLGFLSLAAGGASVVAGVAFALLYGVGNGVATITRGSVPLVLFGAASYGALVGRLLVPSFVLSAVAPLAYAETAARFGARGTVMLSLLVSLLALAASLALFASARRGRTASRRT